MQIEQEHCSSLSHQLLGEPANRLKVIKILHQALVTMGFKQSAQQLQREADLEIEDQIDSRLTKYFTQRDYSSVKKIIEGLELPLDARSQIEETLAELQILELVQKKDYEQAIEMIMTTWPKDELKQVNYLTKIATDQPIEKQEFSTRENCILEKCTSEASELKSSIDRMLKSYLQSKETASQIPALTFKRIACESQKISANQGKPSFIKLSPKGSLICLICETKKQTKVSIWSYEDAEIIEKQRWQLQDFGNVQMMCWDDAGSRIAFCSHHKVSVYDISKISEPFAQSTKPLVSNAKILCCRWHPTGSMFFGGLFDYLIGVDGLGSINRTVRPFMRTRDIIFISHEHMFGLSATRSQVIKYDLKMEKVMQVFEGKASFMSMQFDRKSGVLAVTNKQYVYLLNGNNLNCIRSIVAPSNEKMYQIEAYFANNWLIVYNEKLTGILQNQDVIRHHLWPDCDAIDIFNGCLVTVREKIILWQTENVSLELQSNRRKSSGSRDEWYSQRLVGEDEEMESLSSPSDDDDEDSSDLDGLEENQIQIQYMQNSDNQYNSDDDLQF